jgi:aspartate ammonia-lyase
MGTRKERDAVGFAELPEDVRYGIQSLRAKENFPITGRKMDPRWIRNITLIKKAAATVNGDAGYLPRSIADAVIAACDEILSGDDMSDFIVDAIQGGAGTSANMNVNEVVANRAIRLLGGRYGDYSIVHPNDHVNMHQSTNDVIPTSGKLTVIGMASDLETALGGLRAALLDKAEAFDGIVTVGRTQLEDAVPVRLGQIFGAFASMVARDMKRIDRCTEGLHTINMGGTAIGTAINVKPLYLKNITRVLSEQTGVALRKADDLIDSTQNVDGFVEISGALKACAVDLSKMSNDLRLLASGPCTGFCEIVLPARQNGSSIMPGKINPVIPEVVSQAAFIVVGNDTAVTMAAEAGQLELNAFEPVILDRLFESLRVLTGAVGTLTEHCIKGITANSGRCEWNVEHSMAMVTALAPKLGYTLTSDIAHEALTTGETVRQIVLRKGLMTESEADSVLDARRMTSPEEN